MANRANGLARHTEGFLGSCIFLAKNTLLSILPNQFLKILLFPLIEQLLAVSCIILVGNQKGEGTVAPVFHWFVQLCFQFFFYQLIMVKKIIGAEVIHISVANNFFR